MICIDIDGVIADFSSAYLDYISSVIDVSDYVITNYDFITELELEFGVQLPSINDFFNSKHALSIPVFPYIDSLKELNPVLLTNRPKEFYDITEQWLKRNKVPYKDLVFSDNKLDYILRNDVKLLVDDNPSEVITKHYCKFLLMDRPYNQHVNAERVHNLKEVLECFKNYTIK